MMGDNDILSINLILINSRVSLFKFSAFASAQFHQFGWIQYNTRPRPIQRFITNFGSIFAHELTPRMLTDRSRRSTSFRPHDYAR